MDGKGKFWFVTGILIVLVLILVYGYVGITGYAVKDSGKNNLVKIGFMGPLTGEAASYGQSIKRGVELALEDSGLNNVKVIYEDSGCDGKKAVDSINKLINIDEVVAIVGEVCSGATLAASPIAESNKILLISSSSTSPKITDSGDYIFRTVPSDALQGDFGAKLVFSKGYGKLAVLYINEDYGVGFESVLKKSFEKLGGKIVSSEAFERGATDLKTQITNIKSENPNAIYLISNSPDSAVIVLKQIKELGVNSIIFGSEGLKSDDILKGAGDAANGLIVSSVSSGTTGFIAKYKSVYGSEPGPFAAQAYDAFSAIAKALKKGAKSGTEIKNELYKMQLDGASGNIKFDSKGDVAGNYIVYAVKSGKFEQEK